MINSINIFRIIFFLIPISLIFSPFLSEAMIFCSFLLSIYFVKDFKFSKLDYLIIIYFTYLILNIILQFNFTLQTSKYIFLFRFILFSLLIGFMVFCIKNILKNYLFFFIFIIVILLIDSLVQYLYGQNLLGFKNENHYRVSSLFGDEYILGSYVGRFTPLLIAITQTSIKKNKNLISFIILFISVFITFLSGDRASVVFPIITTLVFIFINRKQKYTKIVSLIIFVSILIFLNLTSTNSRFIKKTFSELKPNNEKYVYLTPYHHNYAIVSWNMFKSKPIIGHGFKSFRKKCNNDLFKKNTLKNYGSCSTHSHNYYLQAISEHGIVGFFLLFTIFLFSSLEFFKNIHKNKNFKSTALIYLYLGIVINLFPFMPSGNFFNSWLLIIFFIYVGLINFYETRLNNNSSNFV